MSKNALFIGNGEILNLQAIRTKLDNNYNFIIALDGGIGYCKELDLKPDLVIGDIDSARQTDLLGISVIKKQNQDLTDFEFAADYCLTNFNVTKIDAIAVTSLSRIDHSLLNIYQVITRLKNEINVVILTENNTIKAFDKGNHQILCQINQTISLIILTKTLINYTQNLRWNINNFMVSEPWFGVSNIAEKNVFNINIEYGHVMVIIVDNI